MNRAEDDGLPLRAAIIWAFAALCSISAFFVALSFLPFGGFPWFGAGLHIAGVALAYWGGRVARGSHGSSAGWALLVSFFALFGGPPGFLAGLACYLFGVGQPSEMPLIGVVKAEVLVRTPESPPATSFDVQLREELCTQPIVDLLPCADVATAIAIISKLADRCRRGDLILLREISQDKRPEVYQFAFRVWVNWSEITRPASIS
ncbi:MAG: hypothetical protein KF760_33305 [Candidatus Eremiobacteraeota bacterium]|nr:hypothetical protein [Candidatus Eremiobacteraeota bacterium]MCW5869084.1 hypothetical protein [Candidatus Eremiobacteraeota bacterium]